MILVTGATGNVGRHVVSQLVGAGAAVRALTRDPESGRLPAGVDVVRGDLFEPSTLEPALYGAEGVFLLWPTATAEGAAEVIELVGKQARRIVFLSSMGVRDEEDADPIFHADIERLIARSGLEWTFLRAGGFATNTLIWADQIRAGGVVRWAYGGAGRSLIHERDIASVAVRALTEPGHSGEKYVLTGPQVVTQAEQIRIIGDAIGRPVRWEDIPAEEAREQLLASGWPPEFAEHALRYWATLESEPEPVTTVVEQVTGVPARTFHEWAADHATDFR